jgi:6-phosphofructokinase 2
LSTVRVMLSAALDIGNIELVKPNQKELSALAGN